MPEDHVFAERPEDEVDVSAKLLGQGRVEDVDPLIESLESGGFGEECEDACEPVG